MVFVDNDIQADAKGIGGSICNLWQALVHTIVRQNGTQPRTRHCKIDSQYQNISMDMKFLPYQIINSGCHIFTVPKHLLWMLFFFHFLSFSPSRETAEQSLLAQKEFRPQDSQSPATALPQHHITPRSRKISRVKIHSMAFPTFAPRAKRGARPHRGRDLLCLHAGRHCDDAHSHPWLIVV